MQGTVPTCLHELTLRDGTVVRVGLLTLKGLSTFEAWCRKQIIQRTQELAASLPGDGRAPVLQEGTRASLECSLGSPTCAGLLQSPEGICKFLEICCLNSVTAVQMLDHLNMEDAMEAIEKVMEASMGKALAKKKGAAAT